MVFSFPPHSSSGAQTVAVASRLRRAPEENDAIARLDNRVAAGNDELLSPRDRTDHHVPGQLGDRVANGSIDQYAVRIDLDLQHFGPSPLDGQYVVRIREVFYRFRVDIDDRKPRGRPRS